jgi:hypothetical protein
VKGIGGGGGSDTRVLRGSKWREARGGSGRHGMLTSRPPPPDSCIGATEAGSGWACGAEQRSS